MDQAFSSPSLRNRINLPQGSFSNATRGRSIELSPAESLPDHSTKTLCCRQLESSTSFLQKAAFSGSPAFSPFLLRKNSVVSPSKVLNSRLPARPFSGSVISSAGASVKAGASLSGAAVHRVIRAGGHELYSQERRSDFQLLQPSSHPRVINTARSSSPAIINAPPSADAEYARFYVFDWDNTLCPTEWLCELYARSGQNLYLSKKPCQALNSPAAKPKIEQLQQHVRKLLLKCREKGEIAIVSNATTIGLIRTLRLLPVIQKTIDELHISVISSRDMCEPHGLPLEDWKDTALIHMLLDFAGRHVNEKLSVMTIGARRTISKFDAFRRYEIYHVLQKMIHNSSTPTQSFYDLQCSTYRREGDQDFEHVALLNASEYLQQQFGRDSRPKCIKYVENPSIDAVIKQTTVFTDLLDQVSDDESGTYMMDQDGAVWRA